MTNTATKISAPSIVMFLFLMFGNMENTQLFSQDVEAVKRRLSAAVEAKELSKEQAGFMLEALKLSLQLTKDPSVKQKADTKASAKKNMGKKVDQIGLQKKRYDQIAGEIKEMVDKGKMSKEAAEKKLFALRKEMSGQSEKVKDSNILEERKNRFLKFKEEIENAVGVGKLSKQEAERSLNAMRAKLFGDLDVKKAEGLIKEKKVVAKKNQAKTLDEQKVRLEAQMKQIEAAVRSGKLSKEDAKAKINGIRKNFSNTGDKSLNKNNIRKKEFDGRRAEYEKMIADIKNAVKSGKISKESAKTKLEEINKKFSGSTKKTIK